MSETACLAYRSSALFCMSVCDLIILFICLKVQHIFQCDLIMLTADTARRLSKYCRAARNPCCFPGDQWSRVTFSCEFKFLVWGKTQGFCGKPVWIKLCSFSLFSVSYPFMLHVCCDWSLKWNDQALEKGVLHQHWVESKTPVPSPQGKLFPVGKARGKEGAL